MTKEGFDIFGFKKGDVLTRVQRGFKLHYTESEFGSEEPKVVKVPRYADFMGKPVIFHGIYNNQIHVQPEGKDKYETLSLEEFTHGWDYYEKPDIEMEMADKSSDDENRLDDDQPHGVMVNMGEPPEFIKKLLMGKKPFGFTSSDDLKAFKEATDKSIEKLLQDLDKQAQETQDKINSDRAKYRKVSRYFDIGYIVVFLMMAVINLLGEYTIEQKVYNTLTLIMFSMMYGIVKYKGIKELIEKTSQAIENLKLRRGKKSTVSGSKEED